MAILLLMYILPSVQQNMVCTAAKHHHFTVHTAGIHRNGVLHTRLCCTLAALTAIRCTLRARYRNLAVHTSRTMVYIIHVFDVQ